MNLNTYDLFAHATEYRLVLALVIAAASYALIQIALFAGRAVRFFQTKLNSVDASQAAMPALSAR